MSIPRLTFDIETAPLDNLPPFDKDSVKLGNLVDPVKIAAKIAEAEAAYIEDSALYAERGRVLAIGYKTSNGMAETIYSENDNEGYVLDTFIKILRHAQGLDICGFNILHFDLPFIRRRCLILGIPFPFYRYDKWNPWTFETFDAKVAWECGDKQASISLDRLAMALGVGKKTGNGKDFAALYKSDREAALAYLRNDVAITDAICEKML